ncbi:acid phosphatase (class A) [Pseudomonas chlororaphis]|jgi:acid phosphatase (class A)|uniref:acid phosphatase n=1 Tax=Pseudomonas chlororaphis TaxID=587753 RepID=UPI000789EE31|nr:phosphatase PAP2 family protein [Pseudomonas chlororaphis]AMS14814.1 acid phosphatase [Pseudomonas chlororaphis]MCP1481416.1 acid phosphatase (class A) [Pseudomonas chlororaphis]MCP1592232.1 acid phosphatase (class A) [Pseudomonas chlororaphis]WDH35769.1 phosphatase PAP2 family protein [Pseudomonas chlororaphis]WDH41854.1 phosphatase PAP2 family protein [Pseudomonas chlororaphis]
MKKLPKQLGMTVSLAGLFGSGLLLAEDAATQVTDPHFKLAPGYLDPADLPVRLALLGAPPKPDSAALARDEEARRAALALRGTVREKLAAADAALSFPGPAKTFSCALGTPITEKSTPHLYTLMQRTLTDAGGSTYAGKNAYNRPRPFVVHNQSTCRKDMEPLLRTDGSWPSGHSAAGWAWSLVLAEINPARATELMTRGLSYGQSRVICDAHWQSDVDAGRIMGAATVASLHGNPAFLADLEAAKEEVKAAQKAGLKPTEDCAAEGVALSLTQH